jgi:HlyD family secretion protein
MSITLRIGLLVALVLVAGGATWWFLNRDHASSELVLYGNVDLREVDLAFNNSERIAEILVREGDQVKKGQLLARMDTSRLVPQVAQVAAMAEASKVDTANARRQYDRVAALLIKRFASKMEADNAKAALDAAAARQQANEAQLALLHQQLDDAQLVAPIDATVRSRVMEPGEMASPQRPILTLTVNDPKWVRVYVAEPDLVKVRPGMTAAI